MTRRAAVFFAALIGAQGFVVGWGMAHGRSVLAPTAVAVALLFYIASSWRNP